VTHPLFFNDRLVGKFQIVEVKKKKQQRMYIYIFLKGRDETHPQKIQSK
jgi:hypothetical protein